MFTPLQSKQDTIAKIPLLVKMESLLSIWKRRMPLRKDVIKNKALYFYSDYKKVLHLVLTKILILSKPEVVILTALKHGQIYIMWP